MTRHTKINVLLAALATTAISASTIAQEVDDDPMLPAEDHRPQRTEHWLDRIQFSLHGGAEHQFKTDLGGGGDFSVTRGGIGITGRTQINDDANLSFRLDYGLDAYDFSGTMAKFGTSEPWDDIHTVSLGAVLSVDVADDWSVFGGPVLQFSGESGADFGDSLTGGGLIGATYRVSESLTLGGGVGVVSQIEDDVRFFPVFALNWQITDRWSVRNTSFAGAGSRGGLEVVYTAERYWEAAIGGAYQFKRFRLDTMDRVGEDTAIPFWARFTYIFSDNVRVNVYGGLSFNGELTLENSSGNTIADADYDSAGVIGVSGVIRF